MSRNTFAPPKASPGHPPLSCVGLPIPMASYGCLLRAEDSPYCRVPASHIRLGTPSVTTPSTSRAASLTGTPNSTAAIPSIESTNIYINNTKTSSVPYTGLPRSFWTSIPPGQGDHILCTVRFSNAPPGQGVLELCQANLR